MADKTLTCSDCGMEFAFTEREQAFYAEKGFSEPRRCPSCRASRKAARHAGIRVRLDAGVPASGSASGSAGSGGTASRPAVGAAGDGVVLFPIDTAHLRDWQDARGKTVAAETPPS